MHIEVIVVNEETFSNSSVSVIESVNVEPILRVGLVKMFAVISKTYSISSGKRVQLLDAIISLVSVKIADLLQSCSPWSSCVS